MSGWLALLQNLALLGFLAFMGWLHHEHPSAYYASAQEDRALEWASFWSFLIAGVVFAVVGASLVVPSVRMLAGAVPRREPISASHGGYNRESCPLGQSTW